MNLEQKVAVLNKIKEYDRIILFRHKRPDGDAVGATKGLQRILQLTYPQKEVYLNNCDFSDHVAFLGDEDEPIADELYADALGIVVDTAITERISNPKFRLCRELVKIDHHIPVESYAETEWIEKDKTSACEMIVEFYETFKDELKMDVEAATYIYAGMVTDSGRFRYRGVSGDTLRYASILLDFGIDLEALYANLYMKDFNTFKFQSYIYRKMKTTPNGVVYIFVDKKMRKKFNLTIEQAGECITYLEKIKGSLIWLLFNETDDNIRVRLRSRFVTINELANKYGGGGHACASGATVHNKRQMRELIADADALLGRYKSENEGWL